MTRHQSSAEAPKAPPAQKSKIVKNKVSNALKKLHVDMVKAPSILLTDDFLAGRVIRGGIHTSTPVPEIIAAASPGNNFQHKAMALLLSDDEDNFEAEICRPMAAGVKRDSNHTSSTAAVPRKTRKVDIMVDIYIYISSAYLYKLLKPCL